jgi:hypothetical protein
VIIHLLSLIAKNFFSLQPVCRYWQAQTQYYQMKSYSLLFMLFPAAVTWSQDETAIQQWQSQHPATLLISSHRFQQLSTEEQALLGTDVIVFNDKITLAQLEQYSAEKSGAAGQAPDIDKDEKAQFIKDWLGSHQEVLIVKQSEFQAMTPEQQQNMIDFHALVLTGETITQEDLLHYQY